MARHTKFITHEDFVELVNSRQWPQGFHAVCRKMRLTPFEYIGWRIDKADKQEATTPFSLGSSQEAKDKYEAMRERLTMETLGKFNRNYRRLVHAVRGWYKDARLHHNLPYFGPWENDHREITDDLNGFLENWQLILKYRPESSKVDPKYAKQVFEFLLGRTDDEPEAR